MSTITAATSTETVTAPHGHLVDSDTTARIRPATEAEHAESMAAGPEGHIKVDGRRVYVEVA